MRKCSQLVRTVSHCWSICRDLPSTEQGDSLYELVSNQKNLEAMGHAQTHAFCPHFGAYSLSPSHQHTISPHSLHELVVFQVRARFRTWMIQDIWTQKDPYLDNWRLFMVKRYGFNHVFMQGEILYWGSQQHAWQLSLDLCKVSCNALTTRNKYQVSNWQQSRALAWQLKYTKHWAADSTADWYHQLLTWSSSRPIALNQGRLLCGWPFIQVPTLNV